MAKNDGFFQETPDDFHTLQRRRTAVDKYASVNSWLNSVNASPEWQFGHNPGNSMMMLPPNARTGSAMPIFPGPLFPAIRRRRQNIASTSSSKKEDLNIVGHGISLEKEKNHHDGLALLASTNVEATSSSKDEGASKVVSDMSAFPPINADNSPEIGDYFNGGPSIRNDGGFRDFLSRSISDTGNRLSRGQSYIPTTKSQKYGTDLFMATSRLDDTDDKRTQGMPFLKPDTAHLHRLPSNLSNNSGTSPRKLASVSHFGMPPESIAQAKRHMTLVSSKDESFSESNTLSPRLSNPRESFSTQILAPSHPLPSNLGYFGRWSKCVSYWCLSISILLLIALSFCMLQILSLEKEISRLKHISKGCSQTPQGGDEPDYEMSAQDRNRKLALVVSISILLLPIFFIRYVDELPHLYRRLRVSESNQAEEEEEPLSKRLAYRVDVLFSTLPYAKPVALLLATLLLITLGGVALFAVSDQDLWDTLWCSWTYVADSGNHADSVGTGPRIVSVCISFGGMLIFALMLGLVSDAISEKVDSLRKGKSEVIESNHTLILGWSDKMGSLLKQLAIANQSLGGGVVVVLAERDKEEMESDIGKLEFNFMGTSVICRSGSPLIISDLKKVSVSKARAVIVLAEVENADQSDARALRVVLSLNGVKEGLRGHIVVELCDIDNEPLVKLVGGDLVETVVGHDVIGRLMIQCARQPGLAQIWEDILGFENAEFYIKRWPELDGMSFENVLISFPDAIPCGVKVASDGGRIYLNPENDYILSDGDEILVVAEDDDSYAPASLPKVRKGFLPTVSRPFKHPEKILFCGWRRDIDDMILVLDSFVVPGSELWIFSEVPKDKRDKKLEDGGLSPEKLANLKLEHREGNPVIRRHLESLPLETFDSILILADEMLEDKIVVADSRSLATLLLIRDIQSKRLPLKSERVTQVRLTGYSHISWICEMEQASNNTIVICEILDSRTKNLVSVTKIGDYVLSNELVSMALAMVAEDKQINRVLEELFSEEGNELYIRSAEFYVYDQEEISFFEIMIRAYERHEIAIGYRQANTEKFIINPPERAVQRKWSLDDVLIVLAQDE